MSDNKPAVSALRIAEVDGCPIVVAGHDDGTLRRWDLATGRPLGEPVTAHPHWVRHIATAELDGHPVIVTNGDETAQVWDPRTGAAVGEPITGLAWTDVLAVGILDGTPTVLIVTDDGPFGWDLATREHKKALPRALATAIAIVEHGGELLAVTQDDDDHTVFLEVWSLSGGVRRLTPPMAAGWLGSVLDRKPACLTELNGRTVLISSAGGGCKVRVWDMAEGTLVHEPLIGHTHEVQALTIARPRDGRQLIVSAGTDATVRVWDLATGLPVGEPLTGHDKYVEALDTTELDGDAVVVSGGADGVLRVWDPAAGMLRGSLG